MWPELICQITDHENAHKEHCWVCVSGTHVKYFFIGFWGSILPQHFNGYWYFHVFPIRSPHPLKWLRRVLYWKCPFRRVGSSIKKQTPSPCKRYRTPQHPTLSASSAPSLSGCASEPDWVTRRWGPEVPPAVWRRARCFSEARTGYSRHPLAAKLGLHPPRVLAGSFSLSPSSSASSASSGKRKVDPARWRRAPPHLLQPRWLYPG